MTTEWAKAIMRINQIVKERRGNKETGEALFLLSVDLETGEVSIAVLKKETIKLTS